MRNQLLRLLLLRRRGPSHPCISQVQHHGSFTSSLNQRAPHAPPNPFSSGRRFTSSPELTVEPRKPPSNQSVLVAGIFANPERSNDEIKLTLDHNNVLITHDLILSILGNTDTDPAVAKRIFDWVSENQSEKLSSDSYNLMLGILGANGLVKETWDMIGIMKEKGYSVAEDMFVKISGRFRKDGLIDDIEKLKELYDSCSASRMQNDTSEENAVEEDCILLLEKIVASEELDMDLFSRVVGAFNANGNASSDAIVEAVIKSLISIGRMNEGNRILVTMKEAGFVPSGPSRCKIAFDLSSGGKTELALEFMDTMVPSPDYITWESLVKGFCAYGNLDEASRSLRKMVEIEGASYAPHALEALITTFCQVNEPFDGYKLVSEMVKDKGISPSYGTYKTLTKGLLALNYFKEALDIMDLIKTQDHPPYLHPFFEYLSRAGSADDAVMFTKAMTSKRYPAINVFLRLFEAYLIAGRLSEAQDLLSKCPKHIKNHADVLDLFSSGKSGETTTGSVAV